MGDDAGAYDDAYASIWSYPQRSAGYYLLAKLAEKQNEAPDEADAWIVELIAARAAAKKAKNYAEADRIRNELSEKGITLIDTREGTKFTIG